MRGFKKRSAPPVGPTVAEAFARLQAAETELASAPEDRTRREELRLAHNAVADLTATLGQIHPSR